MATDGIQLNRKERDALTLDAPAFMKKYKTTKDALYSKRYNVNKKLEKAGVKAEDVLKDAGSPPQQPQRQSEGKALRKQNALRRQKQARKPQVERTTLSFAGYTLLVNGPIKRLTISHVDKSIQIDV